MDEDIRKILLDYKDDDQLELAVLKIKLIINEAALTSIKDLEARLDKALR